MKPVKILLLFLSLTFASEKTIAQMVRDTIRFAESVMSMEKKRIVLQYMHLTEAEKTSFWPVYDAYSNATQFIEMQSHQMLLDLVKDYNNLTPSEVEKLSKRMLLNDLSLAKVRIYYYRKFKRAVSAQRAIEFMNLDNSIRMIIRDQLLLKGSPDIIMQAQLH